MTYILNIYEKNKYICSNISYNGSLYLKIPKAINTIHYNIFKTIKKEKINLTILNAISVNLGPGISDTKNRNILASAKGLCLSLSIPLIIINNFILLNIKYKKLILSKKYLYLVFINKQKNIFKYNFKKKSFVYFKKIKRLGNFILLNPKYTFLINYLFKKKYRNINVSFYKINHDCIIKLAYLFYLKKKYYINKGINKVTILLY